MKVVLAMDENGGIGYKHGLPWDSIKEDMQRFKALTENHVVIMGRNTFDSLPTAYKPLPNRVNIVMSRDAKYNINGAIIKHNEDELMAELENFYIHKDWCLIGGSVLVKSLWHRVNDVYLTIIHDKFKCDTFAPKRMIADLFDNPTYTIKSMKWMPSENNQPSYTFYHFKRGL